MGCRKSKHAVATENTITKSRSPSVNPQKNKQVEQKVTHMEAIGNDAALLVQQEINNAVSQDTGTAADVEDITEHPEPEQEEVNEGEEMKVEDEDREQEKHVEEEAEIGPEQELEPETEPVVEEEEEEAEPGRLISLDSPVHYFSDEGALEGILSEGLSSEYNSPRHELVKEGEHREVVVEEMNATGLEKAEELREKENDSAPVEEVAAHLATGEVAKSN